jgi:hypothetical protein
MPSLHACRLAEAVPSHVVCNHRTNASQSLLEPRESGEVEIVIQGRASRRHGRSELDLGCGGHGTIDRFGRGRIARTRVDEGHQLRQPGQQGIGAKRDRLEGHVLVEREVGLRRLERPTGRIVVQLQDEDRAMHRARDQRRRGRGPSQMSEQLQGVQPLLVDVAAIRNEAP